MSKRTRAKLWLSSAIVFAWLLTCVLVVYAAWTADDNFDCTGGGVFLESSSCGSGWSTGWLAQGASDTFSYITAPAGGQSSNEEAARHNSTSNPGWYFRTLTTSISSGVVFVRMRASITTITQFAFGLIDNTGGAGGGMTVQFASGNIQIYNGTSQTYSTIQAFSTNTWYSIEFEFDDSAHPDQYRVRIDGGTPTAWTDSGTYSTMDKVQIYAEDSETHEFWIDDIKAGTAFPIAGTPMSYYMRMMQQ